MRSFMLRVPFLSLLLVWTLAFNTLTVNSLWAEDDSFQDQWYEEPPQEIDLQFAIVFFDPYLLEWICVFDGQHYILTEIDP